MKNIFYLIFTLTLVFFSNDSYSCDFDVDGIDDPTAYEFQEDDTIKWTTFKSTGGESILESFGTRDKFIAPVPGNYILANRAEIAYLDGDFYDWVLSNGDTLNGFGDTRVTYASGHDFTGDGIDDAVKMQNRCSSLTLSCYRKNVSVNIAYNVSDGTNAFDTNSDLFGIVNGFEAGATSGMAPLTFADVDQDGISEVCYAKANKNNKRIFNIICSSFSEREVIYNKRIGRLFSKIYTLSKLGEPDHFVHYKANTRREKTDFKVVPNEGDVITFSIEQLGEVVVGNWLGIDNQQVGVIADGFIHYRDPFTEAAGTVAIPNGTYLDCHNSLVGNEGTLINSRNICRIFDCTN